MSENLIYGADILSYGAIPDGKTDCSEAFNKAIANGENLICVPFGSYAIKKPVMLSSNVKLSVHPKAQIFVFGTDNCEKGMIYAQNEAAIIIDGGVFTYEGNTCPLFSFNNVESLKITGCSITTKQAFAISVEKCTGVCVSDTGFDTYCDAVTFTGECRDITLKNITIKSESAFIHLGNDDDSCSVTELYARNIELISSACGFDFQSGKAEKVRIENITGGFFHCFFKLGDAFDVDDIEIEKLNIFRCRTDCNKESAYFLLSGSCDSLEISSFTRNATNEAAPLIPTLIFKAADKSKVITDGFALDNVIAARGLSKTVEMTTARLSNPWGKFIYTFECTVAKNDTLTLPLGDFDTLTLYKK